MIKDVIEANRQRDLWLNDGAGNCAFIPQGWCDDFLVADGFASGIDNVEDDGTPDPELNCYYTFSEEPNGPVENVWVKASDLQKMEEVPEAEAKAIHPALAEHLDKINNE